jgi:pyruvate decarboxylase
VVEDLVIKSKIPTFVAPMGKGYVNETVPNFMGVYAGDGSSPDIRAFVEASDLVLSIGSVKSDFNTTGFTYRISQLHTIDIHSSTTIINYAEFKDMYMSELLASIIDKLDPAKVPGTDLKPSMAGVTAMELPEDFARHYADTEITHEYLWPHLSSWLKPHDILLTETGTSYLGIWATKFPRDTAAISQTLWGSIGYTLPAAQGAALAAQEINKNQRTILFEGDGSFQLTAQEVSTMIRHNLRVTIFLIENDGYTIERWVHGMKASYNDVSKWRYSDIPRTFGASDSHVKSFKIATRLELEALLEDEGFQTFGGMQFVEMHMPKEDAPLTLKMVCAAAAKTNAKE